MLSSDIAIDLGSSTIRIHSPKKGLIVTEPAIMAVDVGTKAVIAIGKEAYNMLGRTGENVMFSRPFARGVVTDLTMAEYIFARYIRKIGTAKLMSPSVVIAAPAEITEVQKSAISDVLERSGIRKIRFIDDCLASMKGSGINMKSTGAIMAVNIGYSQSTASVMFGGEVIVKENVNVGGDDFTNALIEFMRKRHSMEIGPITAEEGKFEIGGVCPRDRASYYCFKGKNIYTSLPQKQMVNSDETIEIFASLMNSLSGLISKVMENLPAEILSDISNSQIILSGGGALLFGMDKYLQRKLDMTVKVCQEPENAVIFGTALK